MTTRRPDPPPSMTQQHDDDAPPASGLSSMQRAIMTIQKMRAKIENIERARVEPIAIIGMGCRFPGGANSPEAFFRLLEDGVDTIREVPPERWSLEQEGQDLEAEAGALRWGSFLDDVDRFDAAFFGISPREAESLDPQQRLLLEVAWEALERAGQLPERLMGSRTGVYIGIWALDYQQRVLALSPDKLDAYSFTGNALSTAAGRLSYVLGLQGPAMSVETACSSSLTAMHLACQSLRNGETNLALAGGVNLMLSPATTKLLSKTQALSPDGRCKAFDARANGFVRGEGCGIVVLKRLSDAERDGDAIIAVIRGSAVNQDGRSTGLTAPNVLSQQALLRQALENSRVAPSDVGYVEAHGTGTSLGDPIEVEALKAVLGGPREKGSTCILGAVKTNIGHLEAAAGVAGLMKVALSLQNERIPGNLHFRSLNPRIDLRGTSLEIAQSAMPWKTGLRPRIGGVSSFGISGTNAHVVLEEAPRNLEEALGLGKEPSCYLLPLSAKTPEALRDLARSYERFLSSGEGHRLLDIAHTASARRSHFEHRLSAVGGTREELAGMLGGFLRGEAPAGVVQGKATPARAKVVFVFSGQGSQWLGMGRKLYEEESAFRSVIDSCDALLTGRLGWSILDELDATESMSRLGETQVAQPMLFAIQIALVELLRSWGIAPDAVIGHSVGEIAAAHVAGILSLDEAVRLIAIRGRILQKATGGGKTASIGLPLEAAREAVAAYGDRLSIAAVNDPESVVLAGQGAALDELVSKLAEEGVNGRILPGSYAFNSPRMEQLASELVERLVRVSARRATLAMYSTVLAECVEGKELDVHYWGRNVRETVDFRGAVSAAIHDGYQLFLEVGPHPELEGSVEQCLAAKKAEGLVVGSLRRNTDDRRALLEASGALYTRGCAVEWPRLIPAGSRTVSLPTYPWQRKRFWLDLPDSMRASQAAAPAKATAAPAREKIAFVFPGQGSQWLGMGRQLLAEEPVFRASIMATDAAILAEAGFSVLAVLEASVSASRLGEIDVVQPVLFAIEIALAALWRSKGIQPDCVIGHSMGEAAAAHVAGILRLEDAVKVICRRSRLLRRISGKGAMAMVELSMEGAASALAGYEDRLSVAVSNGPRATVVAGDPDALDEMLANLEKRGVFCRRVKVDVASHSPQVDPLRDELVEALQGLQPERALVAMCSTVTGNDVIDGELEASYWVRNLRAPVRFSEVTRKLVAQGYGVFIEMSPHPILLPAIEENLQDLRREGLVLPSMRRDIEEQRVLRESLGALRSRGAHRTAAQDASVSLKDPVDGFLYAMEWRRKEGPPKGSAPSPADGAWLLLLDQGGTGERLSASLRECGEPVVRVVVGDRFDRRDANFYEIDPSNRDHYRRLLSMVFTGGTRCRGIVSLFALDVTPFDATTEETLVRDQRRGMLSAAYLAQAILRHDWRDKPKLHLVTRGAQVASSTGAALSPVQAPLWGFARSLSLEHPELTCVKIDLDPAGGEGEERLLREELGATDGEDQVSLRRDGRFVARLVRTRFEAAPARSLALRADATYLVTGGLGGLGSTAARWMVEQGARHLLLVGRREPSQEARAAIRAMEAADAKVVVVSADVTRRADVARVFERLDAGLPPLRGVLHAAGIADETQPIEVLEEESVLRTMAPKLLGTWHLYEATRSRQLDFLVLYSSASAIMGLVGQASYAAANAFLDAVAHRLHASGRVAMSIQWGAFADVGMATRGDVGVRLSRGGMLAMSPAQGNRALSRLLERPRPEVAVMRLSLRQWFQMFPQVMHLRTWSELDQAEASAEESTSQQDHVFCTALEAAAPKDRYSLLEAHVREHLGKVLRMAPESIERRAPLRSLGVDSLMSLEVRNRLEASLGVRLPATLLFAHPHVEALTASVLATLPFARPAENAATTPELAPGAGEKPSDVENMAGDDLLSLLDAEIALARPGGKS